MYIDPQTSDCIMRNQKSAPSLGTAERYGVATIIGLRNYRGGRGEALKLRGAVKSTYLDILS